MKKDYFKGTVVKVWKERFAIIKSRKVYPGAFANIIDKDETTVIIDQSKYDEEDVISVEKDYCLLTFDVNLPFNVVGFFKRVNSIIEIDVFS